MADIKNIELEVGSSQLPLAELPDTPDLDGDRLLNRVAGNPVHMFRLALRTTKEIQRIASLVAMEARLTEGED